MLDGPSFFFNLWIVWIWHRCSDETKPRAKPYKFTNQKLKDLGLEFTPVKQCLYDTVTSLQEKGHLPVPTQNEESLKIQS